MNFKYKSYLQKVLSKLPLGEKINYVFQRYISKNLPLTEAEFYTKVSYALAHYDNFKKFYKGNENTMKYYEFGAGWDLIIPIVFGLLRFEVTCIDVDKLIRPELVNLTIKRFIKLREKLNFSYKEIKNDDTQGNILERLKNEFRLSYIAPLDARNTNFNTDSFDFITSTSVFEHVPEKEILPILNESYRILKTGGILSMDIDYQDHYSFSFDKSITIYNYLKYSKKEFARYNSSLGHQNRLRHSDYLKIIHKTNFKIVKEDTIKPSESDLEIINNLKINDEYKNYDNVDLGTRFSHMVLAK